MNAVFVDLQIENDIVLAKVGHTSTTCGPAGPQSQPDPRCYALLAPPTGDRSQLSCCDWISHPRRNMLQTIKRKLQILVKIADKFPSNSTRHTLCLYLCRPGVTWQMWAFLPSATQLPVHLSSSRGIATRNWKEIVCFQKCLCDVSGVFAWLSSRFGLNTFPPVNQKAVKSWGAGEGCH